MCKWGLVEPGPIQEVAFISQGTKRVGRGFLYLHRIHHSLTLIFVPHYKIYHEAHRSTNYPEKNQKKFVQNLASPPNQTLQQEKKPKQQSTDTLTVWGFFSGDFSCLLENLIPETEFILWPGPQKWLWGVPSSAVIPCDRLSNCNWASWRQTVISSFLDRDPPFNT